MSKTLFLIVFSATIAFTTVHSIQIKKFSLPRALEIVKNTANTTISDMIASFNENFTNTKNKVNEAGEKLIQKAIEVGQQVQGQLGNLLKQRENELKKLMDKANGIDIKECTKISKNLQAIALAAMSNVSSCIVDKIDLGGGYIESISKISNDVTSNLTNISNDINHCSKSIKDSIGCAKNATSKAFWIGTHIIPDVISRIGKLSILIGGLPVSVPSCAVSHGYNTFTQQYEDISRKVKTCVDNKIAENNRVNNNNNNNNNNDDDNNNDFNNNNNENNGDNHNNFNNYNSDNNRIQKKLN